MNTPIVTLQGCNYLQLSAARDEPSDFGRQANPKGQFCATSRVNTTNTRYHLLCLLLLTSLVILRGQPCMISVQYSRACVIRELCVQQQFVVR
jgi:hypothetical protein